MRNSIFKFVPIVSFFLLMTYATACLSFEPGTEAYGFSSDEVFGGGSYLGVDTRDISADRLSALQLKEERGVEVTMVDQDAPAGKAGVKEHDVILSVNGTPVESVEQLRRMIREIPAGRLVTIGISRNGQPLALKAQLAERKKEFGMGPGFKNFKIEIPAIPSIPAMPAMPVMSDMDVPVSVVVVHSSARSGLLVENLTPQLGDFFGARNGQGVLVRSVEKGSRAEKAGFRAGDVIVKVNGQSITDSGDFTHAMRSRSQNTVTIGIIRDKKEQTLTITLPERKASGLLEQTVDLPEIDAEARIDLGELRTQMARLKPQMELAAGEARCAQQKAEQELQKHQDQWKQELKQLEHEVEEQKDELLREFRIHLPGADI